MPRIRPGRQRTTRPRAGHLGTAGTLATRAGAVVLVTATPLALATFVSLVLGAPTLGAGLDAATAATQGPLTPGGGIGWLLHVGFLGVLAGVWVLGLGLLCRGLDD